MNSYMKHELQLEYLIYGKTVGTTEMSGSKVLAHIF